MPLPGYKTGPTFSPLLYVSPLFLHLSPFLFSKSGGGGNVPITPPLSIRCVNVSSPVSQRFMCLQDRSESFSVFGIKFATHITHMNFPAYILCKYRIPAFILQIQGSRIYTANTGFPHLYCKYRVSGLFPDFLLLSYLYTGTGGVGGVTPEFYVYFGISYCATCIELYFNFRFFHLDVKKSYVEIFIIQNTMVVVKMKDTRKNKVGGKKIA